MLHLTDGAKSLVAGSAGGAIAAAVVGALWHIIPTVMPLFGSMISGFGGGASTGSVSFSSNTIQASSPNPLTLMGNVAAAAGPGVIIDNVTTQTAAQTALSLRTGGTEKAVINCNFSLNTCGFDLSNAAAISLGAATATTV